jgi:hypothetical protein
VFDSDKARYGKATTFVGQSATQEQAAADELVQGGLASVAMVDIGDWAGDNMQIDD